MKNLLLSIVMLLSVVLLPINSFAAQPVEEAITKNLGKSNTSVSIRSVQTGSILYENNGNKPMAPASTMKLLTGAAALHYLGEDFRFTTKFYYDGKIINDTLHGNLYIKGGGDPTLQANNILQFAKAIKRAGIRTIAGHVYGDVTLFSGPTLTPGVLAEDESYYFAARTSALTLSPNNDFDVSTLILTVTPTILGRAPAYNALPNLSGMKVINRAKTVAHGSKKTISVKRRYNSDEIIITGNLPLGSSVKEWVTYQNPTLNSLHAIRGILQETGLKFTSTSGVKAVAVPSSATLVYTKHSMTLKALYPTFMKLSNNGIADILVKSLGAEVYGKGETATGLAVLRDFGQVNGLNLANWRMEDGSGLSERNRTTANEQSLLLYKVKRAPYYETFYNGLPVGGVDERLIGGTLRKRFTDATMANKVHAKTGYITNVNTLSGYMTTKAGHEVIFSIMVQNKPGAIKGIDQTVNAIYNAY